jgi:hypothetical protein
MDENSAVANVTRGDGPLSVVRREKAFCNVY